MSGVVDSGREIGYGNIDANYPKQTPDSSNLISTFRQSRRAQSFGKMLGIFGVLVDGAEALPSCDCEGRVDPQHLGGFGPCLVEPSQLGIGACQPEMGRLRIGQGRMRERFWDFGSSPWRRKMSVCLLGSLISAIN
jgi:hypothetical protein